MNKPNLLMTLGIGLALTAVAGGNFNPKPLLDSVEATIEQAVGANASDRVPEAHSYDGPGPSFRTSVIVCPESVSNVQQAAELLKAKLASSFTNRLTLSSRVFPSTGDTVLNASIRDEKNASIPISVEISVFKRSSNRIIISPFLMSPFNGGQG